MTSPLDKPDSLTHDKENEVDALHAAADMLPCQHGKMTDMNDDSQATPKAAAKAGTHIQFSVDPDLRNFYTFLVALEQNLGPGKGRTKVLFTRFVQLYTTGIVTSAVAKELLDYYFSLDPKQRSSDEAVSNLTEIFGRNLRRRLVGRTKSRTAWEAEKNMEGEDEI